MKINHKQNKKNIKHTENKQKPRDQKPKTQKHKKTQNKHKWKTLEKIVTKTNREDEQRTLTHQNVNKNSEKCSEQPRVLKTRRENIKTYKKSQLKKT